MPARQSATQPVYDFGAPSAEGEVLRLRVREGFHGGKIDFAFENEHGEADITVSTEVSPDGTSWAATTAADNLEAVTDVLVPQKQQSESFTQLLRAGIDTYFRVLASGAARGRMIFSGGGTMLQSITI